MQALPHRYSVTASAKKSGHVLLESGELPSLPSAPPREFGGPGDRWSPETLLVAAVGDCFTLTFRAIAAMSKLPWESLTCDVTGTLDRVERVTQFTSFEVRAWLQIAEGTDEEQAKRLLEKAEHACLITNSLKAESRFEGVVEVVPLAIEVHAGV